MKPAWIVDGLFRIMLEPLLEWLAENEGPTAYAVLGIAAAIEYLVPPIPGDTITLFGAYLAAASHYDITIVYLCLTAGSISGSLGPYALGVHLGRHEERWPGFLRREKSRRAIHTALERFERHGGAYLALNRFVPALRTVFFVAAGMVRMPLWQVLVFGGVSAALWNVLLLTIGYALGAEWERLLAFSRTYTLGAGIVVALIAVVLLVRWAVRRKRG